MLTRVKVNNNVFFVTICDVAKCAGVGLTSFKQLFISTCRTNLFDSFKRRYKPNPPHLSFRLTLRLFWLKKTIRNAMSGTETWTQVYGKNI